MASVVLRFSTAIRGSRRILTVAFIFSAAVNFLMLTGPLFMLLVYDRVLTSRSEETLVALVLLVIAIYFFMWLIDFARGRLVSRMGYRLQNRFSQAAFKAELTKSTEGSHQASVTRDLEVLREFLSSPTLLAIMDTPFSPLFLLAIFVFHPLLGWLALAGATTLVLVTLVNMVVTQHGATKSRETVLAARMFAEDARYASRTVNDQAMLHSITQRWFSQSEQAAASMTRSEDVSAALATLTKSVRLLLQSLVLALGAWLVMKGDITAGAMIASSIVLGRALNPIEVLLSRWTHLRSAVESWSNLRMRMDKVSNVSDLKTRHLPSSRLNVRGITVSRGPGTSPSLYNVSFEIQAGEALGVIGRSGAGKSTLAKVLLNQLYPTLGEARLGGELISRFSERELAQFIGYLPQETDFLTGTVLENIAHMEPEPDQNKAIAAAKTAGAHELIMSLPDGYATRIFNNTLQMSGGQRQRIALARAIYYDPALLVLDEPNSALDKYGTDALNAAIRHFKERERSVLIMTHRPMAISECERLLVLDSGVAKNLGPRDEVLKSLMDSSKKIAAIGNREKAS